MNYDDEPVFKRSKWGTSHYTYNLSNPIGLALTVVTVLVVGVVMLLMANRAGPFAPDPAPTGSTWNPPVYDAPGTSPSNYPSSYPSTGP
ncbi:hypothetical protein [Streptomyces sp. G-G2]|uniref:hypothetical protein n=1 Tax=Streptomyces sp. G-G2 TaxID=3046201 RepID=UPI0024BA3E0D|nr:hypothetical protein [Streptomyces sp. G-G2]MDJ0382021.1 hypothetical protein [Streptomyces sp. G-G2]